MNYRFLNNVVGWVVFGIALVIYLMTVAPTASFWDCGEFIAVANELEVPHPPGAPLFLLIGRCFAMFASSPEKVAYMVNLVSVLSSAFTSMFIFWIITALGKKIIAPSQENPDIFSTITLMLAGVVGALASTFCDSVWFNAVEAEVYAMSSFFTALVIWLMLKWEARADEPDHLKWIILIAYMMGLSVGVHLLNLLTIPALALIYYFRKYPFSWVGALSAFGISVFILAFIQYGISQITFDIAWSFEKFFTGTINNGKTTGLGLPFGTGLTIWLLILFAGLITGIYISEKRKLVWLNTALISIVMIYIGFSSYAIILIRSNANPPIDENNPENIINFLSYMKREQYGDRPLAFGNMYNAIAIDEKEGQPTYLKLSKEKRYVVGEPKREYEYREGASRVFPRMYSSQHYDAGPFGYKNFVKNKGSDPNSPYDDKPTGGENLSFFFKYQVWHMYVRYFLWNFVGRESDIQDYDWESGLELAKLNKMPDFLRNDHTRNHYFFLPLILGLLGISWQVSKSKKDALVVGMLFFFTGLAIVLYLNQTPQQPRERDYSYAGSF
ncbi:MAG: DUF2723 domain-containing protein, partial [Bacteroidia bacterium]|nr:DUF2723 domain-containing protein [Bacteroidia bacterium]